MQIPTRKLAAVLVTGAMLLGGSVGGVAMAQDAGSQPATATTTANTDQSKAIDISESADRPTQQVRGTVYVDRANAIIANNTNEGDEPLSGVVVYLQYMNGKGQVSPVFYATSATDGTYHFNVQDSVTSKYGAPSFKLAGDGNFQIRTWIKNPDPSRYSLAITGDSYKAAAFHKRLQRLIESWDFTAGVNVITGQKMALQERPNYDGWLAKPESEWTTSGTSDGQFPNTGDWGAIKGSSVWWESREASGDLPYTYHMNTNLGDHAAAGVKVVGSYVNDEVAERFDAWKSANKGYTRAQFRDAQKQIVSEYEAETGVPGSAIAESVVTTVKADGSYYLPFKGIYGTSRTVRGNASDDQWHTVAPDFSNQYGEFTGLWSGTRRHLNDDYMYVYPVVDGGYDVWMHMYQDNMFQGASESEGASNLGVNLAGSNISGQNFAFLIADPLFDVLEYDSYSNFATPSTTVQTETKGLAPDTKYAIQWYKTDTTGTLVKVGDPVIQTSDATGALASVPITVPDTLNGRTTFTAMVYEVNASDDSLVDDPLYADSFDAVQDTDHDGDPDGTDPDNNNDGTPDDSNHTADYQHVTQGVKIDGKPVESDGDNTNNGEELPADLRDLKVTLTAKSDMTYTNSDGEQVTVKAGTEFNAGDATNWIGTKGYPVVHNFGLATFPKGDYTVSISGYGTNYTIADDSQLKDGNTISITGNIANLFVDFHAPTDADTNEPVYSSPNRVAQGATLTIAVPTFQNKAGETTTPELSDSDAFVQDGQVTLPDGTRGDFPGTITVNEDGSIVVTANDDATTGDYKIPVKVTYKDGSTDTVLVPVTVTDKDKDKDGDGVDDDKDKCANTPEGAKVDENGCSVAPSVTGGSAPAVNGIVGTAITPIEVPISNPGKATITDCTVTGLPAGLTASFEDGKCIISGTPTEEGTGNYTVTISYTPADGAAATTDPATGTYTISPAESKDDDGDGVPNDKDQCANTPEGATVDGNGCTIAPSVTDDDAPTITGTVGTPITPVEVPISNPGKADITGCTVTGLPAGLTASYEDGKCVISGTPTEAVTDQPYQVVINYNQPDGDKTTGKTTDPAEGKATINPAESTPTFNPDGKDPNGNPFVVNPSADDPADCAVAPYVTLPSDTGVVYTVTDSKGNTITADANGHYVYAYGEEVTVTAIPAAGYQFSGDQKIEWKFKSMAAASCLPDWNDGTTKPGVPVTLPNTNDGTKVPEGSTVTVDGPGTATLNPDGSITVTPNGDAKPGDTITATVKDPYGNTIDTVTVTVTEPDKGPDWKDGTVTPGGSTTIPNDGGKVPDGSTVTVDGPGKATLNPDGSITVVADDDAKPGDKITVTVKDGNGNVIDQFTITVGGVSKAQIKRGAKLAKTGSDMAAAAVVAVMGLAAGIAGVIAVNKRRKSDER